MTSTPRAKVRKIITTNVDSRQKAKEIQPINGNEVTKAMSERAMSNEQPTRAHIRKTCKMSQSGQTAKKPAVIPFVMNVGVDIVG